MAARIVPIALDDAGLKAIGEAARCLADGGLVAFPTETVYGIGCNAADPAALARLNAVKRRPPGKPYSIHLASAADVARHVDRVPPIAERLMKRYWPGPLTLVLPTADGKGVGLRVPANQLAIELLKRCPVPLVAPSANRSGNPPAKSAQEAADALGDDLDLILDGGATTLKEASTVLRVTDRGWEILRQGSITADMIRRTLDTTIIFVCTANSCRSPMAEVLCKQILAERLGGRIDDLDGRGYHVLSAGTAATWTMGASYQAIDAMRLRGLDLSDHQSQPITPGMVEDATVIYVMSHHHATSIRRFIPEADAKIQMLDPDGHDVADPVGSPVDVFVACADKMERFIRRHLGRL